MTTVEFTRVEIACQLRHLRTQRDAIARDKAALEEQQRGGHDGVRDASARVLEAELAVLDEVIRKLWITLTT